MISEAVKGFLVLALIFLPLEQIFVLHRQKILRLGWRIDILYYFIGSATSKLGLVLSSIISFVILSKFTNSELQNLIGAQSKILQLLSAIFIAEIAYYIAHRLLHTVPFLWHFHAIHHSSESLDWLTTVRVHPCDQLLTKICQFAPLYCLGFDEQILKLYLLFSAAIAFFIHANIKVKFPVLRWVIVTPEYHHWHHSNDSKGCYSNFSAQIPLIDLLFDTFYLPDRLRPEEYGIRESIPNSYLRQLVYPFQQIMRR